MTNNISDINKSNNCYSPQPIKHKKATTYDISKPGPGLGKAHKYGWDWTDNWNSTPLIIGSWKRYKLAIRKLQYSFSFQKTKHFHKMIETT